MTHLLIDVATTYRGVGNRKRAGRLAAIGALRRVWPRYAHPVSRYHDPIEDLRLAAQPDRPAPAAMEPYLEKVRAGAFRVTDADVEALRVAGYSEDEIFEQTVSAAVSEGLVRLDAALKAVG